MSQDERWLEEYLARGVQRGLLSREPVSVWVCQLLFLPSFHQPLGLELWHDGQAARGFVAVPLGRRGEAHRVELALDVEEVEALRARWSRLEFIERWVLDGMQVCARESIGGRAGRWWMGSTSASARLPDMEWLRDLWRLAARADVPVLQERLEQLHRHLFTELPWRVIEEDPLRVRLFGRLSSASEEALRRAIGALPRSSPVVLDMRGFENMGAALYPIFKQAFRERPRLVAYVSPEAREQLLWAGVSPERLLDGPGQLGASAP
jgi:hypothetical protein